ncbi:MAG: hypothetical protein RLZZ301_1461 [Bacteroidota bacterium]|jgi:nicotinamide riboside kinase
MEKSTLRIAFTGPESSGKSTLAEWLATELGSQLVPEYAREFLEQQPTYQQADLDLMAKAQVARWPKEALIADTEMLVFWIWSMEKYAQVSPLIEELLHAQKFDIYVLCAPDIPWVPDPLRENPNDRQRLFERYKTELEARGLPFIIASGDLNARKELIKVMLPSVIKR